MKKSCGRILKRVNVSSKYTYRSRINFEIFTDYQGEEYKGIQVLIAETKIYSETFTGPLFFCFKSRKFKHHHKTEERIFTVSDKENLFKIKEEKDELQISMDFNDNLLEYGLPHVKAVSIANTENLLSSAKLRTLRCLRIIILLKSAKAFRWIN